MDPDPDQPSLTVLEQSGGRYVEAAKVTGTESWSAIRPFPVQITPADLLVDLRP